MSDRTRERWQVPTAVRWALPVATSVLALLADFAEVGERWYRRC
jgi:hypothetical protein